MPTSTLASVACRFSSCPRYSVCSDGSVTPCAHSRASGPQQLTFWHAGMPLFAAADSAGDSALIRPLTSWSRWTREFLWVPVQREFLWVPVQRSPFGFGRLGCLSGRVFDSFPHRPQRPQCRLQSRVAHGSGQKNLDETIMLDTLVRHSSLTLLSDTPAWHSWEDTLSWHSCWTLFLDTLVGHSCLTVLSERSCLKLLWDTHVGHSWQDTLAWHSCLTLFLDTLSWWSLLDTLAGRSWQDTFARHFCWTLFLDTLC